MSAHGTHDIHSRAAVLDIGENIGALLIYCSPQLHGQQIDVSPQERPEVRIHTDVLERRVDREPVFAALFMALAAGIYVIWDYDSRPIGTVKITGGQVSELDWRQESPQLLLGRHTTRFMDNLEHASS